MTQELFRTYKNVFDKSTIDNIWYLITHKKFEGLESPIKIGKESNVFSALTKQNRRVAVKIYRVSVCDFFKMSRYLSMDLRFRNVSRRKQIVLTWARREFANLLRAYKAGVSVPRPIALRGNVLVMEFIGSQHPEKPAPYALLKDSEITKNVFDKLIENIRKLYRAGLVHGDLSEFNILNREGEPIMIDLSHAVTILAPASHELLERDVSIICKFFNRKGIKCNDKDLMDYIKSQK